MLVSIIIIFGYCFLKNDSRIVVVAVVTCCWQAIAIFLPQSEPLGFQPRVY